MEDLVTALVHVSETFEFSDGDETKGNTALENTKDDSIVLVSNDNKKFSILKHYTSSSDLIRITCEGDPDEKEIVLSKINGTTLAHVVAYMEHHKGKDQEKSKIDAPIKSKHFKDIVKDPWDADFFAPLLDRYAREELYDLVMAANYLGMEVLLHNACAAIATLMKGLKLEEAYENLRIRDKPQDEPSEKKIALEEKKD